MTTAVVDIGTMIARSPEIRGGQPRISGTGVTVQRVVALFKLGLNPDEIASEISHLSYAQVYAALAYYHANRDEIEAAIAEAEAAGDRAEAAWYRSQRAAA